ncbi:MAG: macro domain-containing protein [Oscillospiraceae bacterium]|nr:macro domain-containing protein [Oscillospiraceae bacterium]
MPFTIIRNDITKLTVDAIVNAANTQLQMGGGVCGAIFAAAGAKRLQDACDALAPIKTGEAVATPGFGLPAKHIIHTAGPVYRDGTHGEEALLRSCYINSLELAMKHDCESIAFPLISSGIYGYPKAEALRVATDAIRDFIGEHDIIVSLVVFDKAAFEAGEELLGAVSSYIDEHYVEKRRDFRRRLLDYDEYVPPRDKKLSRGMPQPLTVRETAMEATTAYRVEAALDDIVGNLDESFTSALLRLIDAKGKIDAEVYRRANIDRRLFSKIRGNNNYAPSKPTVLAFAVALELTLAQTEDLLGRAGFALSHSRKFDVIIEYFIANRKYDIFRINEVLFSYDQPLLGG